MARSQSWLGSRAGRVKEPRGGISNRHRVPGPRLRRSACFAAVIFGAATAAALSAAPKNPDHYSFDHVANDEALAHFKKLAAADLPRDLPHLSDPKAAADLRTLWAAVETGPGPELEEASFMVNAAILNYEESVLDTYLSFPTALSESKDFQVVEPLPDASKVDLLAKRFAPELAHGLAAAIVANANFSATLEAAEDQNFASREIKDGLRDDRTGILRLASLAETFMRAPAFGPDESALVAAAFADHAADFAVTLSRKDRASMASSFATISQQLSGKTPQRNVARFVQVLRTTACRTLCSAGE